MNNFTRSNFRLMSDYFFAHFSIRTASPIYLGVGVGRALMIVRHLTKVLRSRCLLVGVEALFFLLLLLWLAPRRPLQRVGRRSVLVVALLVVLLARVVRDERGQGAGERRTTHGRGRRPRQRQHGPGGVDHQAGVSRLVDLGQQPSRRFLLQHVPRGQVGVVVERQLGTESVR